MYWRVDHECDIWPLHNFKRKEIDSYKNKIHKQKKNKRRKILCRFLLASIMNFYRFFEFLFASFSHIHVLPLVNPFFFSFIMSWHLLLMLKTFRNAYCTIHCKKNPFSARIKSFRIHFSVCHGDEFVFHCSSPVSQLHRNYVCDCIYK